MSLNKISQCGCKGAPARVTIGPTSKFVNDGMNITTVTAEVFQLIKADRRTRANNSQKFHSIRANSTELLNWQYSTLRIAYYRSDSYCFFCTDIDPERLHMSSMTDPLWWTVEQSDSSWLDECFYHLCARRSTERPVNLQTQRGPCWQTSCGCFYVTIFVLNGEI